MRFLFLASAILALTGCTSGHADHRAAASEGDTITTSSKHLTLIDHDGYVEAVITTPWTGADKPSRYYLVPKGLDIEVPDDATTMRVPLERSVVFSSVHTSPIFELGAGEAIAGVADGHYFAPSDTVAKLLSAGMIADVGASTSPSPEHILALEADAVLMSPMPESDFGVYSRNGINAVPMADYLELDPLGRAEWIKLLGYLYGKPEKADSIYNNVCDSYLKLKKENRSHSNPKVLTETLTSGVWYLPAGDSYMARMLADAGGMYPWADVKSEGSIALDAEGVLDRATDADVWFIRSFGPVSSPESLAETNPAAEHIKAFREGNVYVCDTSRKNIFNDIAFHPERVLRDFVIIMHPENHAGETPSYYEKL
ncbi:MAG: ABC transporter substrate-binding protein [Muribaculaceae bacterium]|nr:ABC transporter substrate-binding protein [Muribaculaceae bacterium]